MYIYSTNRVYLVLDHLSVINEAVKAVKKFNFRSNVAILQVLSVVKLQQADNSSLYMHMVEYPPNKGYLLLTVWLYIY